MLTIVCAFFVFLMFYDINSFIDASRRGFLLFTTNVLPILFPFFFLTSFMTFSGIFSGTPRLLSVVTSKLYKVDGKAAPVLLLSLVGGFPTSARMLSELYERGELSRTDAIKISTFTSTTSPIFIIGTVGVALYGNVQLGVIIFVATVMGALMNGLLYRNLSFKEDIIHEHTKSHHATTSNQQDISTAISNALTSSIQSILSVGGLIVIFFILGNQLDVLLNLSPVFDAALSSLLEMTVGVFKASSITPQSLIPVAILSFGGLCVGLQGMLFFRKFHMPLWFYLLYKVTHMLLSIGVAIIILSIF